MTPDPPFDPDTDLHWARPVRGESAPGVRTGVLVLDDAAGDGGVGRAALLAGLGVGAVALRPGRSGATGTDGTSGEVTLARCRGVIDLLVGEFDRVVLWGHGRGAETALLIASHDDRVDGVVALAPPEVPSVAVERIRGEVVCVAGGADPVWPSAAAANAIEARRTIHGQATRVVIDSLAGHDVVFPAELAGRSEESVDPAALSLGRLARPAVRRVLGIPDLAAGEFPEG